MAADHALYTDLDAVARDAGDALSRTTQPRLYDRLDWFQRTLAHCPPPGRPLIARARDERGAAWLFLSRRGPRAQALARWYTLAFDVVRSGDADGAVAALPGALRGIGQITLSPVEQPDAIVAAFRAAGWHVRQTATSVNWRIAPGADFAAFWAARPGKLRSTVARKSKKAGLAIAIHRGFDAAAWDAYRAIYDASWKGDEGSWPFMRAMAEAEGAAGTLRLGIAVRDGQPVAAQLWTVEHDRATIHKLAYRDDARAYSPGSILSHAMFEHVITHDRPAIIDYGTGDQPYKADWMDAALPLWRVEAADPRHPAGLAAIARDRVAALVRRVRGG
ncbi:GNAT family N-acetyltransferase [Sphingomonas sp.]|uniref:GNAT family N-acetyltransferase n=1 Tax=Sphingomonas sp. TaxID=28214 RepID=UPI002CF4A5D3|nr:GNAT family N-acetyltransferase [Sphingomonas sp.]HTG38896.1 GNAT family N-acetyltransferase [Sphingomonas sp.]